MPKFFCDYCDVYLTHDSMSVRKAHNSGRNHIRNVIDYYQQIGQESAQVVIDQITNSYAAEGQASSNPMLQFPAFGGHGSGPQFGGGFPSNAPPFPPQGFPPGFPAPVGFPPTGFPPGFPAPNGMPPFPPPPGMMGQGSPAGPPQGNGPPPFRPQMGMPPGFPPTNGMNGFPPRG